MRLKAILSATNESTNVNIIDYNNNKIISHYDGKNSINTHLNEKEVVTLYTQNNELCIVILSE